MSELLRQMQRALILQDVYVRKAEAHTEGNFDPKYSKDQLGVQIKFATVPEVERFELSDDSDPEQKIRFLRFSVETGVRFVVADSHDTSDPAVRAEITATFSADYAVKNQNDVTDDGVMAFSESENVTYHVWPYWREFIHSTCARLRLPSAVLPMYRPKTRNTEPPSSNS